MLNHTLKTKLVQRCTDPIEAFSSLGTTVETRHGPLTHIDRGSNVLCVAHLDYVQFDKNPRFSRRGGTIYCGQLDDRLGAFIALDLLPSLGVTTDILLTDSEEVGCSTAQYFDPPKEYNWIVQFDRQGTDLVMYEYDCKSNREMVEEFGFKVGIGSFTDICWLNHLEVSGFNIGTGYYRQHTPNCYATLYETVTNARKFVPFWKEFRDTRIPAPPVTKYGRGSYRQYGWESGYDSYNGNENLAFEFVEDEKSGSYRTYDDVFCPACGYYSADSDICNTCGEPIIICANCGEPVRPDDWECFICGEERNDVSLQEFINRFERDRDDPYHKGIAIPFDDDDDYLLP